MNPVGSRVFYHQILVFTLGPATFVCMCIVYLSCILRSFWCRFILVLFCFHMYALYLVSCILYFVCIVSRILNLYALYLVFVCVVSCILYFVFVCVVSCILYLVFVCVVSFLFPQIVVPSLHVPPLPVATHLSLSDIQNISNHCDYSTENQCEHR